MKLTNEIIKALQRAVKSEGSVDAAARSTNLKKETLSDFLNRSTSYVRKETWEKMFPLLKPYMPPEMVKEFEVASDDKVKALSDAPISHPVSRMHRDLASLTSDEKILLDAFNDLPEALQQEKLLELTELARKEIQSAQ